MVKISMDVLVFATDSLMGVARFPKALQEAGFRVSILCPQNSFISKTRFTDQCFYLTKITQGRQFIPSVVKDVVNALISCSARFIIPADERAVYVLHHIVRQAMCGLLSDVSADILKIIQSSLCDPNYFEATNNKNFTQQVAQELGLAVPKQIAVENSADALAFAAQIGYPVVLKKGIGFAAQGVKICKDSQELAKFLSLPLFAKPSAFKTLVRRWLGRDTSWIPNSHALMVQQFVHGTPAVYTLVALSGQILTGFAGIKEGVSLTGQTTRLRAVQHEGIAKAAARLMAKFSYTGFADLEFILDGDTPYLLECNPRPTPVSPFGKYVGSDLCQALLAGLTAQSYSPPTLQERTIVLFPQEWLRDPQSAYLSAAEHDIPWDDPELMRSYILNVFP